MCSWVMETLKPISQKVCEAFIPAKDAKKDHSLWSTDLVLWHSLMPFKQHVCGESPIRSCSRWAKPHLGVGRGCSIHDGLLHEVYHVSCVLRLLMELMYIYIYIHYKSRNLKENPSYWVGIKKCLMSSWVPCSIAIQHIKSCQGRLSASV